MNPYVYNVVDLKKKKICYVGKHQGTDKYYNTSGKILLRYKKMFGLVNWNKRFKRNIIEYCSIEDLNTRETYWIDYYGTFKNGLNKTRGGDYDWKYKVSKSKPVLQYDLSGNFLNMYNGVLEASRLNGLNRTSVSDCVTGKQKKSGGFMWVLHKGGDIDNKIAPCQTINKYRKNRQSSSEYVLVYNEMTFISIRSIKKYINISPNLSIPYFYKSDIEVYIRILKDELTGTTFSSIKDASTYYNISKNKLTSDLFNNGIASVNESNLYYEINKLHEEDYPEGLFTNCTTRNSIRVKKVHLKKIRGKRVYEYNIFDNTLIKVWDNICSIAKDLGISDETIRGRLKNKNYYCKNNRVFRLTKNT